MSFLRNPNTFKGNLAERDILIHAIEFLQYKIEYEQTKNIFPDVDDFKSIIFIESVLKTCRLIDSRNGGMCGPVYLFKLTSLTTKQVFIRGIDVVVDEYLTPKVKTAMSTAKEFYKKCDIVLERLKQSPLNGEEYRSFIEKVGLQNDIEDIYQYMISRSHLELYDEFGELNAAGKLYAKFNTYSSDYENTDVASAAIIYNDHSKHTHGDNSPLVGGNITARDFNKSVNEESSEMKTIAKAGLSLNRQTLVWTIIGIACAALIGWLSLR